MDLYVVGLLTLLGISLFAAYELMGGFLSGAGYQPTPRGILETMLEYANPGPDKRVFDLGSGFGRIVIAVAKRFGSTVVGVEVDPLKVWWSRRRIRANGLQERARIMKGNLLGVDLSAADIVFVFLWDGIMQKLKLKVLAEMQPGTVVVSYYHRFDGWAPEKEDAKRRVFLYRIPPR